MKIMPLAALTAALIATAIATPASAETWTWAPIRNGATLDAHLARADFARPNPLPIFDTLAAITVPNRDQ